MDKERNEITKYEIINYLPDENKTSSQLEAITAFQKSVQKHLVKGHDYGQAYSGYNGKPTLLKSGAEKIIMLMGLRSTFSIDKEVEDHKAGYFFYRVKCQLRKNDEVITEGFGECNTEEDKYTLKPKSRKDGTVYYSPTKEDQRRYKFTVANTVLKMAKKRAMVDAVLIVASLSNIFTQDIEDMEDYSYNTTNTQKQNNKKQNTTENWLEIHAKGVFKAIKNIPELDYELTKQQKNKLLCKLGTAEEKGSHPKNWKELNPYQVQAWKDRLYKKEEKMKDRVKEALIQIMEEEDNKSDEKEIQQDIEDLI
jgi:hypothetical protein